MHHVLPAKLPLIAQIPFQLLELRQNISVISAVYVLRKENMTHCQKLVRYGCSVLHQRRVKALQRVGIGLQSKADQFLQLPIHLFVLAFQLFRHAGERPFPIRRRQIKAAPVHIGRRLRQAVRLRTDHAAVLDKPIKLGAVDSVGNERLILPEDSQIRPVKTTFPAVRKTHPVRMFGSVGSMHDHADAPVSPSNDFGSGRNH